MGYFKDIDVRCFITDRNAKLRCESCGVVYSDESGAKPSLPRVEFEHTVVEHFTCPNCGGKTFMLSFCVEPTLYNNEFRDYQEDKMSSTKEEFEVDEEEDE